MRKMLCVLATLGTLACGDKDGDGDSGGSESGDAGGGIDAGDLATAEALWAELGGYEAWPQIAPWEGVQVSESVHGSHVQIWANPTAADHIAAAGGGDMADGAIHVKEGYSSADGAAEAITVMKKSDGSWFYARYSPDGEVELAGESALGSCQGCHSAGQDEVRFATW